VSIAYAEGRGVPKDPAQALVYAQRACKGGSQAGCVRAELARIKGEGVAKDVQGGLAQLDGMCARKQALACENLASLYDGKTVADVGADPVRVRDYLKKACDAGSNQACQIRSVVARGDKVDSEMGQGNALFEDKCAAGSAVACGLLGENLMKGTGVGRDPVRGAGLLKKACEQGGGEGMQGFGRGRGAVTLPRGDPAVNVA
jgi:TPR repeat protein